MFHSAKHTRKISPRLGILGCLGFLGFFGFVPFDHALGSFPFLFFGFFGFFSFYYEGKMSSTLMDERFLHNKLRAERKAYSICCGVVFLALLLTNIAGSGWSKLAGALDLPIAEMKLAFLTIVLALAFGLGIFLQSFLLYRYDHEADEEGDR